jgi:hypothetical protein
MAQSATLTPELARSFESYAEAWTTGDIDAFISHWTPDAIF